MKSSEQIEKQQKDQLYKLLGWVGSRKRLADECGVTPQAVYLWIQKGRIPKKAAVIVDQKTDGLFKKEDMRPDVVLWEVLK